jgi:hypothetical protein
MESKPSLSQIMADRPTRSGYGQRVVALVDVLGASAALNSPASARRFSEALAAVISPIVRNKNEPWLVLPHVETGEEVEIDVSLPITANARVTTISDSIVISVPCSLRLLPDERLRRVFDCLHAVKCLQRSLLTLGLRTRGGLTIGGLIHKSHLVVGPALVRAHQMESIEAIMPRVLIDDEIVELLLQGPFPSLALFQNRVAHAVRRDQDERYFVDYLTADPISGAFNLYSYLSGIWKNTEAEFAACPDLRIRSKLGWMIEYIERMLAQSQLPYPRFGHADARFTAVFPRTSDNLKSWADEVTNARVKEPAIPATEADED